VDTGFTVSCYVFIAAMYTERKVRRTLCRLFFIKLVKMTVQTLQLSVIPTFFISILTERRNGYTLQSL
jgi:hypothetical protein